MSKDFHFGFVSLYFLEIYYVAEKALGLIFFALWNGSGVDISHFFFSSFAYFCTVILLRYRQACCFL